MIPSIRVDYIIEGYASLGVAALWRGPAAFLTAADRAKLLPNCSLSRHLPPAVSLRQAGMLIAALDGASC